MYDALGQGAQQATPAEGTTNFVYDGNGRLIAEMGLDGFISIEYIYLDDRLIAVAGSDSDGDGIADGYDNCVLVPNPLQINTNAPDDPFGNRCDPDVNNDNTVNFADYSALVQAFNSAPGDPNYDPDLDFNSNGAINFQDVALYRPYFLQQPGPAGMREGEGNASLMFVHSDYLSTPIMVLDESGATLWDAEREPFGARAMSEHVDGDGGTVTLNVGFPGQYYDSESDLFYNYFRYYDASTGRYITSDPIGLYGGINSYSYTAENPIGFVDPFGLRSARNARRRNTAHSVQWTRLNDWVARGFHRESARRTKNKKGNNGSRVPPGPFPGMGTQNPNHANILRTLEAAQDLTEQIREYRKLISSIESIGECDISPPEPEMTPAPCYIDCPEPGSLWYKINRKLLDAFDRINKFNDNAYY